MDNRTGVIADYRVLDGPNAGKIYRVRFETVVKFGAWAKENSSRVRILRTMTVVPDQVYWENRWVAVKA